MTPEEIDSFLSEAYSKQEYEYLFDKASKEQKLFNTLWEMIKTRPEKDGWRLMWILDHGSEKSNKFILPILDELYQKTLKTKNESFIRHAMKLILRCPIEEDYAGELLDRCIIWMNDPKAKISSQGLGLEFFYQVCQLYPEMKSELIATIDNIVERGNNSAGYKHRLNLIRNELEKQRI